MKIVFGSVELARSCNLDAIRLQTYGAALATTLSRRLGEIAAAEHLAQLRTLPAARVRADPVRRDSWMLISLGSAADLQVRPGEDPLPILADGVLDEAGVRRLLIGGVAAAAA